MAGSVHTCDVNLSRSATESSGRAAPAQRTAATRRFGDYELLAEIGCGGMGVVYKARHRNLQRVVALKMILGGRFARETDRKRFWAEARAVARLDHPHIVPIYEVGELEGLPYFTMKLVEGGNLAERMTELQVTTSDAGSGTAAAPARQQRLIPLLIKVAQAVAHAHQHGILHRDLKPANILIDADGEPYVSDFGLARRLDEQNTISRTGAVMGTPNYMAPEQALGRHQQLSAATDIHALGAILYHLVTGRPPFAEGAEFDILRRVIQNMPEAPCALNPDLDPELERICLKCLAKNPADRYPSAAALVADLEQRLGEESTRSLVASRPEHVSFPAYRRVARYALGAAGLGGALVLAMLLSGSPPRSRLANAPIPPPAPGTAPELVWIPPGSFLMGSPPSEPARVGDESRHPVTISQGLWLGKHEVTQAEYTSVMGSNPSFHPGANRPVEQVTWFDATNYCWRLTGREGAAGRLPSGCVYRLPTEAQWEYACRAGTSNAFHYGPELRSGMANFDGRYEYPPCGDSRRHCENPDGIHWGQTTVVGQYKPNGWGLYDMHGNVYEWCEDWYQPYPPGPAVNSAGPAAGARRVFRGGCAVHSADHCRAASRFHLDPTARGAFLGFRVALVFEAPLPAYLVWMPPGTFEMGSPEDEAERGADEIQHRVAIARGFWISRHEVTQAEYAAVMGNNPSFHVEDNLPVEQVSWFDAADYCRRLTAREQAAGRLPEGCMYRLPTEAEWEYACRAETTTAFSSGCNLPANMANFDGRQGYDCATGTQSNAAGIYRDQTVEVESFGANSWGLHDLHGNVFEWCQDWYAAYPNGPVTNPIGPATGTERVFRGGNWFVAAGKCRSACRFSTLPSGWHRGHGFRVVLGAALP